MTSRLFFELVSAMREAQTQYFRTRSSSALQRSKKLEQQVDKEISRVREVIKEKEMDNFLNPEIF